MLQTPNQSIHRKISGNFKGISKQNTGEKQIENNTSSKWVDNTKNGNGFPMWDDEKVHASINIPNKLEK